MTPAEIAAHAAKLQGEAKLIPPPSMSNYKGVLASYKRILNDILVMIREMAEHKHDLILDMQATRPRDPE